ncbi:hypothetical protein HS1genome_1910 [Sulfodiicoccus acidiphilus]|uniref:CARDB domain-containing protein n=1 Tax=Sulfodiicoccus acidiphilus TaxID=1670455 RepID=A0A348B5R9_9CREN|nr:S-layer protein SlaA [Sulfodiicoccus acidiphilus]BBD73521.1 hypothetical protein HS1genome_1910 [Sulfodiicoccus acidiphilus]
MIIKGDQLIYNGMEVATFVVVVSIPGRQSLTLNLNQLGYREYLSYNDTFTVPVTNSQLNSSTLPPGTTIQFEVNDLLSPAPNVTYVLTAPPVKPPPVEKVSSLETLLEAPTNRTFSSSVTAYLPSTSGTFDQHTLLVYVRDEALASKYPSTSLNPTAYLYLKLADGSYYQFLKGVDFALLTLNETYPDSGNFTGSIDYYLSGGYVVLDGHYVPADEMVGAQLTVSYSSLASLNSSNATVTFEGANMSVNVSSSDASPGAPVNVTLYAPGLVKSSYETLNSSDVLFVDFVAWNGGPFPAIVEGYNLSLVEESAGSPYFLARVYLGNASAADLVGDNSLTAHLGIFRGAPGSPSFSPMPTLTVAPGSTVMFYSLDQVSDLSSSSGVVPVNFYTTVRVKDVTPTVKILNSDPSTPYDVLSISLNYSVLSLLDLKPVLSNSPCAPTSGAPTSGFVASGYVKASVSGETINLCFVPRVSLNLPGGGGGTAEPGSIYYLSLPMTLWNGTPNSYSPAGLNVNATDSVSVTVVEYQFTNKVSPSGGITDLQRSDELLNGASVNVSAFISPVVEEFWSTQNLTDSLNNTVPIPQHPQCSENVNVTVWAPEAVNNPNLPDHGRSFNVTVTNNYTNIYTIQSSPSIVTCGYSTKVLTLYEIGNSDYYTANLVVLPYSFPGGSPPNTPPGELPVFIDSINRVSVKADIVVGEIPHLVVLYYFPLLENSTIFANGSSFFYVGSLPDPSVTSISIKGQQSNNVLTVGNTYSVNIEVTNLGTGTGPVNIITEIQYNHVTITSPETSASTLYSKQTITITMTFTPSISGTYTVTTIFYQNQELSEPYPISPIFTISINAVGSGGAGATFVSNRPVMYQDGLLGVDR